MRNTDQQPPEGGVAMGRVVEMVETIAEKKARLSGAKKTKTAEKPVTLPSIADAIRADLVAAQAGDAHYRAAGEKFLQQREALKAKHGAWTKWLRDEKFPKATAYRYMAYAQTSHSETFAEFCNRERWFQAERLEEAWSAREEWKKAHQSDVTAEPVVHDRHAPIVQGDETPPSVQRHEAAVQKAAEPFREQMGGAATEAVRMIGENVKYLQRNWRALTIAQARALREYADRLYRVSAKVVKAVKAVQT